MKLSDPTKYDVVASAFAGRSGIEQVNDQRQILDKFFRLLGGLQFIALLIAVVMLIVTVLLIVNTMRVAAFSRRRETSIMRLVGASNFYIQLPFLLEAALAAGLGAVLAIGSLILMKSVLIDQVLAPSFQFTAFVAGTRSRRSRRSCCSPAWAWRASPLSSRCASTCGCERVRST